VNLAGSVDLVGDAASVFARRRARACWRASAAPGPRARPRLPDDTRLWAALQQVSGGTWGGCVYTNYELRITIFAICHLPFAICHFQGDNKHDAQTLGSLSFDLHSDGRFVERAGGGEGSRRYLGILHCS
jgi:hypothetical protein